MEFTHKEVSMSPVKQELLAAIEVASDEVLTQTLMFIKKLDSAKRMLSERANERESLELQPSKLDKFSEFLQSAGYYEDEYIERCMAEITNK
jgi:hypothetical protein